MGDEAALAELQASIRAADAEAEARAAASALLRGRPRLWLVGQDGIISEEVGAPGVLEAEELRLIPGSAGAVRRLRLSGKVAILSKPSARGKGPLGAAELDASNEALRHQIATTARGGRVGRDQWDAIYVCEVTLGVGVGVRLALALLPTLTLTYARTRAAVVARSRHRTWCSRRCATSSARPAR